MAPARRPRSERRRSRRRRSRQDARQEGGTKKAAPKKQAAAKKAAAPLEKYHAKRDFEQDAGAQRGVAQPRPTGARRFVVQRHRARRLHYDFRLEIDGVLVSWAVPKGVDPRSRRRATSRCTSRTTRIDYLDFEGVIPAGEYGGGDVIVWDRGTWELHDADDPAAAVASGELHVDLHGEKLRGRFVLVRTRRAGARQGAVARCCTSTTSTR